MKSCQAAAVRPHLACPERSRDGNQAELGPAVSLRHRSQALALPACVPQGCGLGCRSADLVPSPGKHSRDAAGAPGRSPGPRAGRAG